MDFEERKAIALRGRELWNKLTKEHEISNKDYVIIAPEDDESINQMTVKYIDAFIERRTLGRAFIVSSSPFYNNRTVSDNVSIIMMSEEEVSSLIQLYELYEFTANIIFASLDKPSGRLGRNLSIKDGVETEDVFKSVVYGLV